MHKILVPLLLLLTACNNYYPCNDERLTVLEFKQFRQLAWSYYSDKEAPNYGRIDKNLDSLYLSQLKKIKVPAYEITKDTIRSLVVISLSVRSEFPYYDHALKMIISVHGYDMDPSIYDDMKREESYTINCFEQAFEEIWLLSDTQVN